MVNFVKEGDTIAVTAPYTVTSGMLVLVGSIVGIAAFDAEGVHGRAGRRGCFRRGRPAR